MKMCKRIILIAALAAAVGCVAADGGAVPGELKLQLPPAIYAVPGLEANLYFDNVVLTVNPDNYVFDVECAKGRNDARRWRFTPEATDAGTHPFKLRVFDQANHLVAEGETKVVVTPASAGTGKKISLLLVGDSLTDITAYPRRIAELFGRPDNPELRFVGSHGGGGKPAGADGVRHEGYGGWRWKSFCETWSEKNDYRAKSKFLVLKNGKPELDVAAYFKAYNQGQAPDFIIFMLGSNDVYSADDAVIDQHLEAVNRYQDRLLAAFRRAAPDAVYGLAISPPPAGSQDAFGANYRCGQTRWQFKRNQHRLAAMMLQKFSGDRANCLIPVYINLDTENGFPVSREAANADDRRVVERQNNGIHPAESGYRQIGDSFYCWLKAQLNRP